MSFGHARAEIGIFACPFDHAAPAGIASDVDHRREGPVKPADGRLDRCDAGRTARNIGVEACGHAQRHRHDGSVAVDNIHREEQRNTQSRLFDSNTLQARERFGTGDVQIGSDPALTDPVQRSVIDAGIERFLTTAGELCHLAEFFRQAHLRDQVADPPLVFLRYGSLARCEGREASACGQ